VHAATRALSAEALAPLQRTPRERALLDQAARELLLAQSSDFPFILRAGTVVDYAQGRVRTHLMRFWTLLDAAHGHPVDERVVQDAFSADILFPDLEFRAFAPRPGLPGKARHPSGVEPNVKR
jgi:1,4-alpha-glucan branching enzyme